MYACLRSKRKADIVFTVIKVSSRAFHGCSLTKNDIFYE